MDVIVLGTVVVFSNLLPIIITNREVAFRDLLDRYTLQSAFGVAMIVVGSANLLFNQKIKIYFNLFFDFDVDWV